MAPQVHAPRARRIGLLLSACLCGGLAAHPEEFDIVVYGATSGGITAAVQGAKMGKKVALISPAARIGGLSSAGLGWTDLGDIKILGGLSREFYHRVYLHYQAQPNWNSIKGMGGQGGAAFNTTYETGSIFEPKIAEQVFHDMLADNGVPLFTARLDLDGGVLMDGLRITGIRMEDGKTYRGKMFVDASYEGDVMAGAGVTYTMGRESNATYGETINGVRSNISGHQVISGVSAYVVKGDSSSGLLPGLETGLQPDGTGDHRFQAYCFRMCLTNTAANRIAVAQPEGYRDEDFELVLRAVEAGQTTFFKLDRMPNGKTDSNNTGGVSCDYIGRNYGPGWNWATLNHAQRDALAKEHEYWQRGMVWTLQNHPRVKAKVGASGLYSGWGLPADEFADTGHWPYQLYIREARRMVSDYVMTQKNCNRSIVAPDSIGMGAYTMDSHNVQRYVSGGMVRNEGDVQVGVPGPYPISYRSIVPKTGECENLLVPWCLSASHMAFGSIRMEPVFMALGQSSATAAAIAINDGISVQQVPYAKLSMKLRADGQSLTLTNSTPVVSGIVVDNDDATVTPAAGWVPSASVTGYFGAGYLSDNNEGQGTKSVRYTPQLPAADTYTVQLRWTSHANRATNVPVKVFHKNGVFSTTVNQQQNGGTWFTLGSFQFDAGTAGYVLLETTGANGYVIADAVQFTGSNSTGPLPTAAVASFIPQVTRGGSPAGEFVFSRDGDTANPLTLHFTTGGTAAPGGFSPAFPASVTIPAGSRETSILWTAPQAAQPLGPKTLTVTLAPHAAYQIGIHGSAGATIVDPPFEAWRFARFTSAELANPAISGPTADPDGNGADNLLEFFSGGAPSTLLSEENGRLYFHFRRHKDAGDIPSRIWESGNLIDWSPSDLPRLPALFRRTGDVQEIGLPLPGGEPFGEGRKFFQLRVGP